MYPPTTSTMRIDRIEPSRRRKDRVLVFLEGGDLLRVTEQELLVFGLRPGLELPEQLLAQVEQSAKRSEMKARGARLTGSRMLSKKQVMEHLTRKGGDRELAEDTAQWLEELGAVDESAYAAAIARHYAAMGYGPGRVRQELQRRGIPQELWDDALALLPEGEEAIERFIRRKCKGKPLDRETQRKLAAALQRRGFSWQEIRPVLNRLGEEMAEESGESLPKGKLLLCKTTSGGIFLPIILLIASGGSRSHFHRLSRENLLECSFARSQIHIPNIRGNTA